MKFTVLLGVLNNYYLSKKSHQFQAKRLAGQSVLKPISTTKFSFSTKGLNLRQIDSCAVWFSQCALKCLHVSDLTTYFKEIYNYPFDFEVFLALYNKAPISSSYAECFGAIFEQQNSWAQFFAQVIAFKHGPIRANLKRNDSRAV